MHRYMHVFLGAILIGLVYTQHLENESPYLLQNVKDSSEGFSIDEDDDFEVEFDIGEKRNPQMPISSNNQGVKRLWGIPDTIAFVGRMFSYHIPIDAFEGDLETYEISSLPDWLLFNSHENIFEGVPGHNDIGSHYITVKVTGKDKSFARDIFAIEVSPISVNHLLKESKCSSKDELMVVNIMANKPLSNLTPKQRIKLLQSISLLFKAKLNKVTMTAIPMDVDHLSSLIDSESPKYSTRHSNGYIQIQWTIGCRGKIAKDYQNIVNDLDLSCKSGKLERLIHLPVVECDVVQLTSKSNRVKRNLDEEYSGDYIDNDYEYDYEDYYGVLDRVIPSQATPVYSDIPNTLFTDNEHLASPVFRPVPLSTPAYIPIKPTLTHVDASPTVTFTKDHSDSELHSSLLTHPTTSSDFTTPLVTTSINVDSTRTSKPIEATHVPDISVTTEYNVKNFPPRISNRIKKLAWIAGNVYRMRIPKDTFFDIEDGNTRNLTLVLKDENGYMFPRDYWIQFDPQKQEVYALPLEKDIGNYNFFLEAVDRDHKSVKDIFTVSVRQHSQARNFHHQFTAVLKLEKKYEYDFAYSLDWQVSALEKIAHLFQDSTSNINIRNITKDPIHITWTNVSLIDSTSTVCPIMQLEAILEVLLAGEGSDPTREAVKIFKPEFHLKKIKAKFFDPCEQNFHFGHGHKEPGPIEETGHGSINAENSSPIARNQIDQLTAVIGQLYRYQVPMVTCYDLEDGNTRNLKLRLLTTGFVAPPEDYWLQFDSANQEFYGLPLSDDLGRKEYLLECMDKGGKTVTDSLIVEVIRNSSVNSARTPVHFGLTIDYDYDILMSNAYLKSKLINRIGQAFGDYDASNVRVDFLRRGSVVVEWHNGSLPTDPCPKEEVQRLRNIMTNDNGQLRKKFKKFFLPDFSVVDGEVIPSGSCLAVDTPTYVEAPNNVPLDEGEVKFSDEDYLLTFIIPAVIIAVMLLLAAAVACCVYRRRRYGKMRMTDDRTFVSKGIPIIFAEELDEHHPDSAKNPIIMKEEKPPMPPPEYQTNSPSWNDRPRRNPVEGGLAEDAPYHPPPPFTSNGSSRNQRPNLPPAYRKPPTYVPP